jgi:hypothetical protein
MSTCIGRVASSIYQDLIYDRHRKRRPKVEPQRYAVNVDFLADQRDDVVDGFVDVELRCFERALPNAKDDQIGVTPP